MQTILLVITGLFAALMAWAIGAQDVSNALGTSVGSKALTVRQAIYVGAVCEFLGSLVGGNVAGTISSGILNISQFAGREGMDLYSFLMLSTMGGAFVWLLIATKYSLPVSTTHSLVGSLIAVGWMAKGIDGVKLDSLTKIVLSWVTSPLMGGVVSYTIFYTIHSFILTSKHKVQAAREVVPYYVALTIGVCVAFLLMNGPAAFRLDPGMVMVVFFVVSGSVIAVVKGGFVSDAFLYGDVVDLATGGGNIFKASPKIKNEYGTDNGDDLEESKETSRMFVASTSSPFKPDSAVFRGRDIGMKDGSPLTPPNREEESQSVEQAEFFFLRLMVLTAAVVSFAHGSNDVSNCIGPFTAVVDVYLTGDVSTNPPPFWILVAGGVGIVIGLATYGYKVMETVGESIAKLTFSRGYAAQIGTAATVLTASQMGLSVSTTHCLIGAITGVALVEGTDKINQATIKKIIMSWVVTIPASMFFSSVLYVGLKFLL